MRILVTVRSGRPGVLNRKYEYDETYFESRGNPEAVFLGDECIPGPFCKQCGWPFFKHGEDKRRPADVCPPPFPVGQRNPLSMDPRPDATERPRYYHLPKT